MSQKTITSFFNSRKRPANDYILTSNSKILHIERVSQIKSISTDKGYLTTKSVILTSEPPKSVSVSKVQNNGDSEQITSNLTPFAKKTNANNNTVKDGPSTSEKLIIARKDLSLGDIRKRLAGSSKLAELKATADRLTKGIQELKEASEKRNLREFKSIDVEVLTSPSKKNLIQNELQSPIKSISSPIVQNRPLISPRKVVISPIKSPTKVPAYIKHASLATTSTSLPLPHHYRFLAELFRGMETVVALLYNRNEKITFAKLKPSIQEMLKRSFTDKHLSQIKYVVPDFYNFEVQKIKNFSTSTHKEGCELIISPNLPNDIKNMNPTVLLERRRYFYDVLLKLVKKHHSTYLQSLDPPMEIPDDKLTRWHPEFEIEKIPEIELGKLPEMPNVEKFSSAQDVLAKARELFKCNTKMERALDKLAQAKSRGLTEQEKAVTGLNTKPAVNGTNTTSTQTPQPSSSVTLLNPALRNLPAALLEKVKAKQAAKALDSMTRSTQGDQKYLIYCRLPDLARTLRNIFVTERKNVLALNIIVSKLNSSFKSNVTVSDLERDIRVLTEEMPDWIKLLEIRSNTYLKLDKAADLQKIISKLEALATKYKSN